jgi:hypothetical protein
VSNFGQIIVPADDNLPGALTVIRPLAQKGSPMFTTEQYRAKAAEYSALLKTANGPNEVSEFQKLERSFTELADNEQWVTDHHDQTLHAPKVW